MIILCHRKFIQVNNQTKIMDKAKMLYYLHCPDNLMPQGNKTAML